MRFAVLVILISAVASVAGQETQFAERNPRYRLQPGDVIELQYVYTPEYNQSVNVQPDGFASLTLAGELKLAGLTVQEAQDTILEKVGQTLRDPQLTVLLTEFESPSFVVAGDVAKPGKYEMRGTVTVVQAIAEAGGFTDASKKSQVILYRRAATGAGQARLLNMKDIMTGRGLDEDPTLRAGDMLVIPKNRISKVKDTINALNVSWGIWFDPIRSLGNER